MIQPFTVLRVFVLPQTFLQKEDCCSFVDFFFFLILAIDFTILIFCKSLTAVILLL